MNTERNYGAFFNSCCIGAGIVMAMVAFLEKFAGA